jgi:hypothetical protein
MQIVHTGTLSEPPVSPFLVVAVAADVAGFTDTVVAVLVIVLVVVAADLVGTISAVRTTRVPLPVVLGRVPAQASP